MKASHETISDIQASPKNRKGLFRILSKRLRNKKDRNNLKSSPPVHVTSRLVDDLPNSVSSTDNTDATTSSPPPSPATSKSMKSLDSTVQECTEKKAVHFELLDETTRCKDTHEPDGEPSVDRSENGGIQIRNEPEGVKGVAEDSLHSELSTTSARASFVTGEFFAALAFLIISFAVARLNGISFSVFGE